MTYFWFRLRNLGKYLLEIESIVRLNATRFATASPFHFGTGRDESGVYNTVLTIVSP